MTNFTMSSLVKSKMESDEHFYQFLRTSIGRFVANDYGTGLSPTGIYKQADGVTLWIMRDPNHGSVHVSFEEEQF